MSNGMHILFVCWGNICRSPAAEATFRKLVQESEWEGKLTCDSVGTINSHAGNPPDTRMQSAAKARGIQTGGHSRMITNKDFEEADWLLNPQSARRWTGWWMTNHSLITCQPPRR